MKRARLERLLRVRGLQEEMARAAWLAAEHAAAAAEEQVRAVHAETRAARAELGEELARGLAPPGVLWRHAALDGMDAAGRRLTERARTLRFQAARSRAPWEERRAEARGLERLRDKQRAEARRDERTCETAEIDEIAANRAARRSAHAPDRG